MNKPQIFLALSLSTDLQSPRVLDSSAHSHIPLILTPWSRRKRKHATPHLLSELPVKHISFPLGTSLPPKQRLERKHESLLSCSSFCSFTMTTANNISKMLSASRLCHALCTEGPGSDYRDVRYFIPRSSITKSGCFSLQVSTNQLERLRYKCISY